MTFVPTTPFSAFAFPDDYSFGILQSSAHWLWFITKCSKFKSDFRYTPESVFDTFPWPQSSTAKQIEAVAEVGCEVRRIRAEASKNIKGGLRSLYRTLELPGANPLKDAHVTLDAAVLDAYGFSSKERFTRSASLALNLEVAKTDRRWRAGHRPGHSRLDYPEKKSLVSEDCIRTTT